MIKQKKSKLEMILQLGFLAMCMWFKNGLKGLTYESSVTNKMSSTICSSSRRLSESNSFTSYLS